ncbi:MAG: BrnT family toxin [bacterium]
MIVLNKPFRFDWDEGNKNYIKHKVLDTECEEIFFDKNKVIFKDSIHSKDENRFIILGKTKKNRILFIVFTLRNDKIRIISARDINNKEKKLYEKAIKN